MTPEAIAASILTSLKASKDNPMSVKTPREIIADAVRFACNEEREACAKLADALLMLKAPYCRIDVETVVALIRARKP